MDARSVKGFCTVTEDHDASGLLRLVSRIGANSRGSFPGDSRGRCSLLLVSLEAETESRRSFRRDEWHAAFEIQDS